MALTGLQIYKLLPKTNCGDCSNSTCLSFAMKLAANKATIDECPHISNEARETLGDAASPPVRQITIGSGEVKFDTGKETVLFRHDETFYNQTAIAIEIDDCHSEKELEDKTDKINKLSFDRAGMKLSINAIALKETKADPEKFCRYAEKIRSLTKLPLILMSLDPGIISKALVKESPFRPLIYAADKNNFDSMMKIAKDFKCPVVLKAGKFDEIKEMTDKAKASGVTDLIIDSGARNIDRILEDQTAIRRLAVKKGNKSYGYPTIAFSFNEDPWQESMNVCLHICKYAGISITRLCESWQMLPLLTLRQNIFTDPQKPIQVEPKLYPIGSPDENSPVIVTTNFSLTYFLVAGEIEASKVPAHLLIVDTEGTSVLTAWAADKFNAVKITQAIKESGIENSVSHRNIILPGYVSVLAAPLKAESGWEPITGPKEAAGIPSFLKTKINIALNKK